MKKKYITPETLDFSAEIGPFLEDGLIALSKGEQEEDGVASSKKRYVDFASDNDWKF